MIFKLKQNDADHDAMTGLVPAPANWRRGGLQMFYPSSMTQQRDGAPAKKARFPPA